MYTRCCYHYYNRQSNRIVAAVRLGFQNFPNPWIHLRIIVTVDILPPITTARPFWRRFFLGTTWKAFYVPLTWYKSIISTFIMIHKSYCDTPYTYERKNCCFITDIKVLAKLLYLRVIFQRLKYLKNVCIVVRTHYTSNFVVMISCYTMRVDRRYKCIIYCMCV